MNLSAKQSSIHHHLTRPVIKKTAASRSTDVLALDKSPRVESGFGILQIGNEALPVAAAYKPIFRF